MSKASVVFRMLWRAVLLLDRPTGLRRGHRHRNVSYQSRSHRCGRLVAKWSQTLTRSTSILPFIVIRCKEKTIFEIVAVVVVITAIAVLFAVSLQFAWCMLLPDTFLLEPACTLSVLWFFIAHKQGSRLCRIREASVSYVQIEFIVWIMTK